MDKVKLVYVGRRLSSSGKVVHAYVKFAEDGNYERAERSAMLYSKPLNKYLPIGGVIEATHEGGGSWKVGDVLDMLRLPLGSQTVSTWRSKERADIATKAERDAQKRYVEDTDEVKRAAERLNAEFQRLPWTQKAGFLAWLQVEVTK